MLFVQNLYVLEILKQAIVNLFVIVHVCLPMSAWMRWH